MFKQQVCNAVIVVRNSSKADIVCMLTGRLDGRLH